MRTKAMKKMCMTTLALVFAAGVIFTAGKATTMQTEAASLKTQVNNELKKSKVDTNYTVTEDVQQADGTVQAVTREMTAAEKTALQKKNLKTLFKYAEKKYGYARYTKGVPKKKNWQKTFASEMLKKKKGSCYHFAAAYAYLAKQATDYKVRIGLGKTKGFGNKNQAHAWVEVQIGKTWYVCDPNMDKFAAKSSGKYFLKKRNSSSMKKVYYKYKGAKYVNVKAL